MWALLGPTGGWLGPPAPSEARSQRFLAVPQGSQGIGGSQSHVVCAEGVKRGPERRRIKKTEEAGEKRWARGCLNWLECALGVLISTARAGN